MTTRKVPLPVVVPEPKRFFGKYRGTVVGNLDPMQIGRVTVQVPDVLGVTASSWAMPCVPVAGLQSGIFAVPSVGAHVWVEFEQGDPSLPIWTGGFWASAAEVPVLAVTPQPKPPGQNLVFQTIGQNTILLSDAPHTPTSGGIQLKTAGGAMILINDTGIYLSNGKGATVTLVGPTVHSGLGNL